MKAAVKRDDEVGWREMVEVRGEEVRERRGEDESGVGGSEMVEVREEGGGAKGLERKDGAREGLTNSCRRENKGRGKGEEMEEAEKRRGNKDRRGCM